MQKLITLFLDDIPQRMDSLKKAIECKNDKEVREIAHSIKGLTANLKAYHMGELANAVEIAGKQHDIEEAKLIWPKFEEQYLLLIAELNKDTAGAVTRI